jgi:hypothetical protein
MYHAQLSGGDAGKGQVMIDHDLNQLMKRYRWLPTQQLFGFAGVTDKAFHFGGANVLGTGADVVVPRQPDRTEGRIEQVCDAVILSGCQHIVFRRRMLHHSPHRLHILWRVAPISPARQASQRQVVGFSCDDRCHASGNFAGDERVASARRFVVVADRVAGKELVRFPIDLYHPCGKLFRHAVWRNRAKRRQFRLWRMIGLAEQLAAADVQKFRRLGKIADHFQKPQGSHRGEFTRGFRNFEAEADMALTGEVIDFGGSEFDKQSPDGGDVVEIRVVKKQPLVVDFRVTGEVIDAASCRLAAATNQAMNRMAFVEQKFGEIRTVLASDTGDEGGFSGQDFSF